MPIRSEPDLECPIMLLYTLIQLFQLFLIFINYLVQLELHCKSDEEVGAQFKNN